MGYDGRGYGTEVISLAFSDVKPPPNPKKKKKTPNPNKQQKKTPPTRYNQGVGLSLKGDSVLGE